MLCRTCALHSSQVPDDEVIHVEDGSWSGANNGDPQVGTQLLLIARPFARVLMLIVPRFGACALSGSNGTPISSAPHMIPNAIRGLCW